MPYIFKLEEAERIREQQTALQLKNIEQFYKGLLKDVQKRIAQLGNKNIKDQQLVLLERDIKQRLREINKDIQDGITDSMITTANAVVQNKKDYLLSYGFKKEDIIDAFIYVPDNVVRNILNGRIYTEGWSLSKAIWGYTQDFNRKLSEIISRGTALGKSAYEIALDLEKYVNPSVSKASRTIYSWRIDKQGNKIRDKFYFGKVDYNAQRLARTLISHAYQQSFKTVNEKDPFVIGYKWLTSNFHGRVCEICKERAETNHHGLGIGIFPKDDLPLDHPNGMCTFEAVMKESLNEVGDKIAEWYNSPIGTYPDIDEYVKQFIS